ncbi:MULTISPECIES: heavy metal transporter [unclassified Microbacterium]|uniref:heavy metal transporter n=1 Tax=unclassified Microbacterium TaxID=2609290 RepID=UPI003019BBB9
MTDAPRRVRVTADAPGRVPSPARRSPATHGIPLPPAAAASGADAVYDRALRRAQLRLALGTVAGFVVVVVALTVAIALIPELDAVVLYGVPLSWLLHAFAFYPVIVAFALLYTRAAARNERRYRALRERG